MELDELIAYINDRASKQHGLIRVDQVPSEDRRRLDRLVQRRVLTRAAKGVWRSSGSPVTWEQSLMAGWWALGSTALVSHRSAARLYGFDRFDGEFLDFTVDRAERGRRLASLRAHVHTGHVRTLDRRTVSGFAVTSPERTILDLARCGTPELLLEAAVDSTLRLRLSTLDVLLARVKATAGTGRWGVARLDDVLFTAGGHSFLERRFLKLVRQAKLPLPEMQVVHRSDGRHIARVDFLFRRENVVVEVSGGRGHSSAADRASDAGRRNGLQQLGRIVLEFTYEMIINDEDRVLTRLKVALRSRQS